MVILSEMDSVVVPQKRPRERESGAGNGNSGSVNGSVNGSTTGSADAEHDPDHEPTENGGNQSTNTASSTTGATTNGAGEEKEHHRKRARLSCNICKARKTKCVGVETGACQYCRTLGIPCEADPRSRKRPFYRVSGEVYEHSIKLLRRFVPEQALPELTVDNIQALLQKLDSEPSYTPSTPALSAGPPALPPPPSHHEVRHGRVNSVASSEMMGPLDQPGLTRELDTNGADHPSRTPIGPVPPGPPAALLTPTTALPSGGHDGSLTHGKPVGSSDSTELDQQSIHPGRHGSTDHTKTPTAPAGSAPGSGGLIQGPNETQIVHGEPVGSNDMMEADEHPLLQEELGCLLLDSMGKYRYVGADSSIRWNHAARIARGKPSHADPKIIPPMKTGLLPPTSPESPDGRRRAEPYLPPRQLCMTYVARFFDQIHCIYWFYSAEQFHTRLHHTYDTSGTMASSSWLCALYSIFAMGSMSPLPSAMGVRGRDVVQDSRTALDYLALAKSLSAEAADEADVDSIKAFGLLSLATHAACYSVTAYLHLGTAMRIGFSLGLHRDLSLRNKDPLEWERSRRLWWTIYVLDYEMASRFGYPCSVTDDSVLMTTPPPTEHILSPGPNTPLGYQSLLVSLIQLRKNISNECFLKPAHVGGRLPISSVTRCLRSLRQWLDNVPTHLRCDSSLHPQHRRAVSLLHLRFWTAIISLTRPFLLFLVAKPADAMIPVKRHIYEQMSNSCIEAAEAAVEVIKAMREDKTLSSLMLLDVQCIGEVMWILILAVQQRGGTERQDMLRFCLDTLKGMEMVGWCEKVAPELEARAHESGVLELAALQLVQQDMHTLWPGERGEGFPNTPGMDGALSVMQGMQGLPGGPEYTGLNLDGSQFDVFETLDLDSRSGMMDMFMDASFLGSQFLFDDFTGLTQHGRYDSR